MCWVREEKELSKFDFKKNTKGSGRFYFTKKALKSISNANDDDDDANNANPELVRTSSSGVTPG